MPDGGKNPLCLGHGGARPWAVASRAQALLTSQQTWRVSFSFTLTFLPTQTKQILAYDESFSRLAVSPHEYFVQPCWRLSTPLFRHTPLINPSRCTSGWKGIDTRTRKRRTEFPCLNKRISEACHLQMLSSFSLLVFFLCWFSARTNDPDLTECEAIDWMAGNERRANSDFHIGLHRRPEFFLFSFFFNITWIFFRHLFSYTPYTTIHILLLPFPNNTTVQ